ATMTGLKPRFAFRPRVENLESRLQPGSIITSRGYDWSFVADRLLNLDQGWLDSQSLVSQASSESGKLSPKNIPIRVHRDHQDIEVAPLMAARNDTSSLPARNLEDNVVTSLTNDDLGLLSQAGRRNGVLFMPAQNLLAQQLSPRLVSAGFGK